MNSKDDYDQLKRRNRRRLVGALVMVLIAIIILLVVFNRNPQTESENEQVTISGLSDASTTAQASAASMGNISNEASGDYGLNEVSNASATLQNNTAEPANTNAHPSSQLDNQQISEQLVILQNEISQLNRQIGVSTKLVSNTVATPTVPTHVINPAVTATKPTTESQPKIVQLVQPIVKPKIVEPQHTQNQVAKKEPAVQPKAVVPQQHATTPPKPVIKQANQPANTHKQTTKQTENTHKPTAKSPVKPPVTPVAKPKNQALTPQQILNNQASGQVKNNTHKATSTASPSNGSGKAIIQVGAYINEAQAQSVQQKLHAHGVSTQISHSQTSKGTLYRVRTGVYNSHEQANQNLTKIRAAGLDGLIIGQ